MRKVAYLRVSTEKQGDSKHGLNAQWDACCKVGATESFQDVASGGSGLESRPGLLNAIASLEKGDVIVVNDRSRLGRDPLVLAYIESAVARKGATIESADGVGNGNDPTAILLKRIVDAMNEFERQVIKARTTAALQGKKRRNERTGYIPYGYMLDVDGIHLIENPAEQHVIHLVLQLRKDGMSLRAIADHINSQCMKNRKGVVWHYSSINRLINKQAA